MALPKQRTGDEWPPGEAADWRSLYDVEDPQAVAAYIAPYPHIPGLLTEAFGRVRSVFPESARPRLTLQCDPGAGDQWLTLLIPLPSYDRDAAARLDRFDDEWWFDAAPRGEPVIVLDIRQQ